MAAKKKELDNLNKKIEDTKNGVLKVMKGDAAGVSDDDDERVLVHACDDFVLHGDRNLHRPSDDEGKVAKNTALFSEIVSRI